LCVQRWFEVVVRLADIEGNIDRFIFLLIIEKQYAFSGHKMYTISEMYFGH